MLVASGYSLPAVDETWAQSLPSSLLQALLALAEFCCPKLQLTALLENVCQLSSSQADCLELHS